MATPGLPQPDTLSLPAQVAQLLVVRASGHLFDHQRRYPAWELSQADLKKLVANDGVGGVILLGGSAADVGLRTQQLQEWAQIPLLLAADIEEGVGQRFAGATQLPPPLALGAIAAQDPVLAERYAEQMGCVTAQEAQAIGLNWLLAPVVDVNNNADNPVINVRAFGATPACASQLACAFIRGAQGQSVLTTAKHFPGHGDTAVDSHLTLPVVPHDLARLEQIELPPFRAAIAAGVDAVMTAHLQVPALDAHYPATLSAPILTGLLRQDLGFNGLVVTDALIMGAIARHYGPYEAAVLALEAGADVLLMPSDPDGTLQAVCEAVRTGRLSQARILASVERLWRAKQKVADRLALPPDTGHAWEHVPPPPVQLNALAQPATRQLAADISRASMQRRDRVPSLSSPASGHNLLLVDDVLATDWLQRRSPAITLPEQAGYSPRLIDAQACFLEPGSLAPQPTLLQLFSRGHPFRATAGLSDLAWGWFRHLLATDTLAGLVIYGSPYGLEALRSELPDTVPYGFVYGHMPAAQTAVLSALLDVTSAAIATTAFTD